MLALVQCGWRHQLLLRKLVGRKMDGGWRLGLRNRTVMWIVTCCFWKGHPLTELAPLIRLRGTRALDPPINAPTLAFAFLIFHNLLIFFLNDISYPYLQLSHHHLLIQKTHDDDDQQQQQQLQDVLLFDPADGILSLRLSLGRWLRPVALRMRITTGLCTRRCGFMLVRCWIMLVDNKKLSR